MENTIYKLSNKLLDINSVWTGYSSAVWIARYTNSFLTYKSVFFSKHSLPVLSFKAVKSYTTFGTHQMQASFWDVDSYRQDTTSLASGFSSRLFWTDCKPSVVRTVALCGLPSWNSLDLREAGLQHGNINTLMWVNSLVSITFLENSISFCSPFTQREDGQPV